MNSLKKIKEWLNTFTSFNEQEQVDCQRTPASKLHLSSP